MTPGTDEFLVKVKSTAGFRTRNDHEFVTVDTTWSLGGAHVQRVGHADDRNCDCFG